LIGSTILFKILIEYWGFNQRGLPKSNDKKNTPFDKKNTPFDKKNTPFDKKNTPFDKRFWLFTS
jgi:hypothetical protein